MVCACGDPRIVRRGKCGRCLQKREKQKLPTPQPSLPMHLWNAPPWAGGQIILSASGLKLTDMPEQAREGVRAFLAPFLPHIPIRAGECHTVSRALMLSANSPRVEYVVGVWSHSQSPEPTAHSWNTIDGHVVDLIMESKLAMADQWSAATGEPFFVDGKVAIIKRAPAKVYTLQEMYSRMGDE
jgi:hypothetical protein